MGVVPTCMYVHCVCVQCLQRPEEPSFLEARSTDSCEQPHEWIELKPFGRTSALTC